MKIIVGLGNPGRKYEKTKHNIGFMVVDQLASEHGVSFKKNPFEAETAEFFENGEKVILVKPQTFMNESGRSVSPLMTYLQMTIDELVVIYDDMDLPLGKIRLRQKGSAGGHNGVKSLISHLGTNEFKRIKVAIGRPKHQRSTVVNHVLNGFDPEEQPIVQQSIDRAVAAVEDFLKTDDFIDTMNRFN